ncbi:MAG: hypothetical protein ACR2M3_05660, partial [Thermomicrobiales bacterium]
RPIAIQPDGVHVVNVLTDAAGFIPADTVILSSGGIAQDGLYHALTAHVAAHHLSLDPRLIGDAFAPRHLRHAMTDGARIGRAI